MDKKDLLNNLFKYYDLTLKIDNILGSSFKSKDIGLFNDIDNIQDTYAQALSKNYYFSIDSDVKNNYIPISHVDEENLKIFIKKMLFYEKSINLEGEKLNKKKDSENIDEHNKFSFSSDSNYYQYGIAFNLLNEKPFGRNTKLIPSFIVLFPNYDEEFKMLTPDKIFIEIKRFLGYKLTEEEKEFICEIKPYLIFNSKILEPYNLEIPNIKLSTYEQTKKEITEFLKPVLELTNKDIDLELQNKPFVIGISQNLNMGLTKIYQSIFEKKSFNNLLNSYFSIHKRKKDELVTREIELDDIITTDKVVSSYRKHYGSFDITYSLANTQREAFTCYLENKKVLPVNGAPGTGKTSLLRAIFGDYTVKSALESYKHYLENKSIVFKTPIACSSTNNQALSNVSEGIDAGFFETTEKEESNLYKRWLANNIKINNKSINFNTSLFIPSVKGKAKREYELSKNDMCSFANNISKSPLVYLTEYFKYREIDIICDRIDKRTLKYLNNAADYFYEKIVENIDIINESTSYMTKEAKELTTQELYIVNKYIKKGVQEDLIKATLSDIRANSEDITFTFDRLKALKSTYESIDEDKSNLKNNINLTTQKYLEIQNNLTNYGNDIESLNKKISVENNYLGDHQASPFLNSIHKELEDKFSSKYNDEVSKIEDELDSKIKALHNESSILDKISYTLLKKGLMQQKTEAINEKIKISLLNLQDNFYKQDFFINELEEIIYIRHQKNIQSYELEIESIEIRLVRDSSKISKLELQIGQLKYKYDQKDKEQYVLEKEIDDEYGILSDDIFEFGDIEKLVQMQNFYRDLKKLKKKNSEFDTSLRTNNFYYAIHLLEALYFINNANMWNSKLELNSFDHKAIKCSNPICNGIMISYENEIKCSKCGVKYSHKNPYRPKELTNSQILYILKYKKATINNISYYVNINGEFINISDKQSKGNDSFTELYPIFPMINITCNSFGTIVSERDSTEVKEDIFEFLLIDEAGTIPPSKMIILNCAKRVMLFGDKEQLKPVLSYDSRVENRILEDFFVEQDDIDVIASHFSCATKLKDEPIITKNNSAMDVANSSVNYFLPYNKSKMDGDIWLKEHFRCRTPIINISNEISYFNEIIPCKEPFSDTQSWSTLLFIEHESNKSSNNTNMGEIESIINFIEDRKQRYKDELFKSIYKKEISNEDYYNSIGIITPFVNQENLLKETIKERIGVNKENNNEPIIKVGTVHKFQGSERDIIIFSSVYNKESIGKVENLFFNRDEPDMINVAVTRAKEVFVLFGNRETISNSETFSGVMVKHIDQYKKTK